MYELFSHIPHSYKKIKICSKPIATAWAKKEILVENKRNFALHLAFS
jgi:hypothetical protein